MFLSSLSGWQCQERRVRRWRAALEGRGSQWPFAICIRTTFAVLDPASRTFRPGWLAGGADVHCVRFPRCAELSTGVTDLVSCHLSHPAQSGGFAAVIYLFPALQRESLAPGNSEFRPEMRWRGGARHTYTTRRQRDIEMSIFFSFPFFFYFFLFLYFATSTRKGCRKMHSVSPGAENLQGWWVALLGGSI